ncbi:MAG: hypothetical protein ACXQS7_00730 [Candidatus Syntropharchaeia archaeon]
MFENTRNVPGWEKAPIPPCFGGDPRGLTFCCNPNYPLAYGWKCRRKDVLREIGLSEEDHLRIKYEFTREFGWDDERVCFGSLAFCCMRKNGCPRRDEAIAEKEGSFESYFIKKRILALRLLKEARNRDKVKRYIEFEERCLKNLVGRT